MDDNYGINSDSMLDAANSVGSRVVTQLNDTSSSIASDFSKSSRLNGQIISGLSEQFSVLGSSTNSWQNLIKTNVNLGLEIDSSQSDKINDIDVPLDYTTNNTMDTLKYNVVFISKLDGKSVNEGEKNVETGDTDIETTVAAENLANLNNGASEIQETDNSTTIKGQSILANINNDHVEIQETDDSTSVSNKNLKDISGNNAEVEETDDSTIVTNKNLHNLSGNNADIQETDNGTIVTNQNLFNMSGNNEDIQKNDDSTSVINQNLANISGNNAKVEESDNSTSITGQSILGNINSGNTTQEEKQNEDAIAAVKNVDFQEEKKDLPLTPEEDKIGLNTTIDDINFNQMQDKEV